MASKAKSIPEGFHSLTPHLIIKGAAKAIEFYKKVFNAKDHGKAHMGPDGKSIMHAELTIGDSVVMLNDEFPDWGSFSPTTKPGAGVCIHMYVDDVDTVFKRAIQNGAKETMPIQDMFWGDRYGKLTDPFGHHWSIATHKENVSPEEMTKRANEAFASSKH